MTAEDFYIEWCLERNPDAEDLIRDHARDEGMQEIFSIMEEYYQSKLKAHEEKVEFLGYQSNDISEEYGDSFPKKREFYKGKAKAFEEVLNLITDNLTSNGSLS